MTKKSILETLKRYGSFCGYSERLGYVYKVKMLTCIKFFSLKNGRLIQLSNLAYNGSGVIKHEGIKQFTV